MKQDELEDPTSDLDAGWGDEDLEESGPVASKVPESRRSALQSKPVSVAPASDETDELDAGWGADDDLAQEPYVEHNRGAAKQALPLPAAADTKAAWDAVEAVAAARSQAAARTTPEPQSRASLKSLKKAQRDLSRKNQEHARRRKRTRKAERKAKRLEQAKNAREQREADARAAREREALLARRREPKTKSEPATQPEPRKRSGSEPQRVAGSEPASRAAALRSEQPSAKSGRKHRPVVKRTASAKRAAPSKLVWLLLALGVACAIGAVWLLTRA